MKMEYWCQGCMQKTTRLKSRCLMQLQYNRWNGFCSGCCCLNKIRQVECNDPRGLGWVRKR